MNSRNLCIIAVVALTAIGVVSSSALPNQQDNVGSNTVSIIDSPALKVISDVDTQAMQHLKHHIENDFSGFKSINEVHQFLEKAKVLVAKHPKNVAFAQGDLKELHRFLSSEIVTRLVRVDAEPFIMPLTDDKLPLAKRAIEDDDFIGKLFGGPVRAFEEARKQQLSRTEEGNHKDGNFLANFWCKITGTCNN